MTRRHAAPSLHEQVFVVDGMHCASCAMAVEARLRRQPGVQAAAVNFTADAATLRWDTTRTSLAALQRAVARLGYRLRLPDDSADQAASGDRARQSLQRRLAVAVFFGMWSMMPALLIYLAPLGVVEPAATWPLALASGGLALPVLLYAGAHFYRVGWYTLRAGAPGLDSLISVAVAAASLVSVWRLASGSAQVYFDAAVMLITFQLVARLIDGSVRRRAATIIRSYLRHVPDRVTLWRDDAWRSVAASAGRPGQRIRLSAGEELALDAQVTAGRGFVDLALLTGEHAPRPVSGGDALQAGCRLVDGDLELRITAGVGQRRIDGIARSVRALLSRKSALQQLADRLARWLLPVILSAACLAVAFSLAQGQAFGLALIHGLSVLIIACPCALSLAIPLVVVLGHARLVALGILFRDPAALDSAAATRVIVFDKTGTLTTATPQLARVQPAEPGTERALLQLARDAMQGVAHPIAAALATTTEASAAARRGRRQSRPGRGVCWSDGTSRVLAGRAAWLAEQGIRVPEQADAGMALHVARDGRYRGRLLFREALHPAAVPTLRRLRQAGYVIYLLSGDTPRACQAVARALALPAERVLAGRSPEEKGRFVQSLERHQRVAFVGDGLNDGLALASAGLGVAVGSATPAARQAAAVYLPDGLARLPDTLALARRSRRLMRHNLGWALGYNAVAIPLAVAGWIAPVVAAVAMTLSSLCVLGNSLRIRRAGPASISTPATQPPPASLRAERIAPRP